MGKIIKKIWIIIAVLCFSSPVLAFDFEVDGLYFDISSFPNRTCILTAGDLSYSGHLNIPKTVNYEGLLFNVTELDSKAFNSNITELTIPSSIATIPLGTISKCKLTKLTIQDDNSPLQIDDYLEKGYGKHDPTFGQPLQYIYIGRDLTGYGRSFGESSSLSEVIIGHCVTEMPAIGGSDKLESVYIPDNVINLNGSGLYKCTGLKTVFVGNGITKIPNEFFNGCTSLETVYLGNNISELEWNVFCNCNKLSNLFIFSDKLTTIGDITLKYLKTVSKIFVPNSSRYDNLLNGCYRDNLIILNSSTNEYTGAVPVFSYKNNAVGASISFPSDLNFSVGSYNIPINVFSTFDNGWTTSSEVSASYTITPAPVTVIADDASKKYGMENPEFTVSFFGFKNGESVDALTRLPDVETTATTTSNVGEYPIIPSGAEAKNYTFSYERGTLTIAKADQTIEWTQQFSTVKVGDVVELTATSSANLPIKYTVTDETLAEIFNQNGKKYIEFLKPGSVSIRATQEGDENYNEADRISKSVKINLPISKILLNQNSAILVEGNSLQLTATIEPVNASNKTLIWESSNSEIATVDANGKVIALKQGNTTITAISADGSNISASCIVTVIKLVSSIYISDPLINMRKGEQTTITAYALPLDATNPCLRWSSEDNNIASVKDGTITAIAAGATNIVVESMDGSNIIEKCLITVEDPSGVDLISSEALDISALNGTIFISNVPIDQVVNIFRINGTLVESEISTGELITYQPSAKGVYIVVVGTHCYKVVIH